MSDQKDSAAASGGTPSNGLLTRKQASEATGLTVFTLDQYRQLRRAGIERGPEFVNVGHRVMYPAAAVDAFLRKREASND